MTAHDLLLFQQRLQVLLGAVSTATGPVTTEGPAKGLARPVSVSGEIPFEYALEDSKGDGSPLLDGNQCRLKAFQGLFGHVASLIFID